MEAGITVSSNAGVLYLLNNWVSYSAGMGQHERLQSRMILLCMQECAASYEHNAVARPLQCAVRAGLSCHYAA
jgi:hypothetical protein